MRLGLLWMVVTCLWKFNFRSMVTPKYLTELLHFIKWPFIFIFCRFVGSLSPNSMVTVFCGLILILHSRSQLDIMVRVLHLFCCVDYAHADVGEHGIIGE